ncbi:MAG: CBS domain-containing protein [Arcicella sp.]|nr:CBS domain-containing protein [Arcicella sp.]
MKVAQILKCKDGECLITVSPNDTVLKALNLMSEHNIGAVVVIEKGNLAGIFSERDYARKGILTGRTAVETLISEVMTEKVLTVSPQFKIEDCIEIMSEKHIRHLPVVENNRAMGMVSASDILTAVLGEHKNRIASLEHYITGQPTYA